MNRELKQINRKLWTNRGMFDVTAPTILIYLHQIPKYKNWNMSGTRFVRTATDKARCSLNCFNEFTHRWTSFGSLLVMKNEFFMVIATPWLYSDDNSNQRPKKYPKKIVGNIYLYSFPRYTIHGSCTLFCIPNLRARLISVVTANPLCYN